jgi:hypothetical protein
VVLTQRIENLGLVDNDRAPGRRVRSFIPPTSCCVLSILLDWDDFLPPVEEGQVDHVLFRVDEMITEERGQRRLAREWRRTAEDHPCLLDCLKQFLAGALSAQRKMSGSRKTGHHKGKGEEGPACNEGITKGYPLSCIVTLGEDVWYSLIWNE